MFGGSESQHSSLAPAPSMNYYESYFEDSFVGDFTGDVNEDKLADQSLSHWQADEDKINNTLEFRFDSFGPESILFQGSADTSTCPADMSRRMETQPPEAANGEAAKIAKNHDKGDSQESEIRKPEHSKKEEKNEESASQTCRKSDTLSSGSSNPSDFDFVSLSITEPQLKSKLNSCFDE